MSNKLEGTRRYISQNADKINNVLTRVFLGWFIVTFLLIPNIQMLIQVFQSGGKISFVAFQRVIMAEFTRKGLINSVILGAILSITVNILGIFMVLVTEFFNVKGAKLLRIGYMTPLVFSGIVVVSGYLFVYGSNGIVTSFLLQFLPDLDKEWFQGIWAVTFVMTFSITINHIIFLRNSINGIDNYIIEAARNIGSSNGRILRKIVLPVVMPTIFSCTVLVFLAGLSALSAPVVVGGDFNTINSMIISLSNNPQGRDMAAALAIILGLLVVIVLVILTKVEKGGGYMSVSKSKSKLTKVNFQTKTGSILTHFFAYLFLIIQLLPMVVVIIFSFTNTKSIAQMKILALSFDNYILVFQNAKAVRAFMTSLSVSLLGSIIAVIVSLIATRFTHAKKDTIFASFVRYTFLIPWMLPVTLICLALLFSYGSPSILLFGQGIIGSIFGLVIAYMIVKLPYSQRMLHAAYYSIDPALEQAAKNMGSSSIYTMRRIIVPILFPTMIALVVLNFISLISEYNISALLGHPLYPTIGLEIRKATDVMASGDSAAMVLVYSVILIIISTLALYLVYGVILKKDKK